MPCSLLGLLQFASPDGSLETPDELASALTGLGLEVLLVDLRAAPPVWHQKGAARQAKSGPIIEALLSPEVDLESLVSRDRRRGFDILRVGGDPGLWDESGEKLARLLALLQDDRRLLLVAGPPPLVGLRTRVWVVPPLDGALSPLHRSVIRPLEGLGMTAVDSVDGEVDLLVVVPLFVRPTSEGDGEDRLEGEGTATSWPVSEESAADDGDLVSRTYHLPETTVSALALTQRSLVDQLGHHVRKSRLISLAIRHAPVPEVGERPAATARLLSRTYHLPPATLRHLSHLQLLASRLAERHVPLSEVVDDAVREFCGLPPEQQCALLERNERRRPGNRA